jgi:hypothetical protein
MKHLIQKKYILLLAFIVQIALVGSAQADTIALSFSGSNTWNWPGATIGWEFTVSEPITVTSLGVWDESGDGFADDHQVGIWLSSGGAPLVSTTVTSANPLTNGFRYQSITPFTLQPGTYVIGSYMPTGNDYGTSLASYSTQSPITYTRNLYLYGSGFTIPTDEWVGYDGGNFGPNFQFVSASTAVPTMTEWGMIIFMTLAGFGSAYYLRRQRRLEK